MGFLDSPYAPIILDYRLANFGESNLNKIINAKN